MNFLNDWNGVAGSTWPLRGSKSTMFEGGIFVCQVLSLVRVLLLLTEKIRHCQDWYMMPLIG